jgi:hypothetical protein
MVKWANSTLGYRNGFYIWLQTRTLSYIYSPLTTSPAEKSKVRDNIGLANPIKSKKPININALTTHRTLPSLQNYNIHQSSSTYNMAISKGHVLNKYKINTHMQLRTKNTINYSVRTFVKQLLN